MGLIWFVRYSLETEVYPMKKIIFVMLMMMLAGCETAYYNAWEKVGVHKRDLLVDRIEDTQDAQEETQEQFKDALEQYRAVVNFDGGDLEKLYNKLNSEYEDSESAAETIRDRIDSIEQVGEALFEEWQSELELYSSAALRRDSMSKLRKTKQRYQALVVSMHRAESKLAPALTAMRDNVLYLKHNLNTQAIAALKGELKTIDVNVNGLLRAIQQSIDESDEFINQLKQQGWYFVA